MLATVFPQIKIIRRFFFISEYQLTKDGHSRPLGVQMKCKKRTWGQWVTGIASDEDTALKTRSLQEKIEVMYVELFLTEKRKNILTIFFT